MKNEQQPSDARRAADGADRFPYGTGEPRAPLTHEQHRIAAEARAWRHDDPVFAKWADGLGVVQHDDETQLRVRRLVTDLAGHNRTLDTAADVWKTLSAADRLTSAAMWLVVHMTYAKRGGTLDTFGILFANRCTWAHVLATAAAATDTPAHAWLSEPELAASQGRGDPQVLR